MHDNNDATERNRTEIKGRHLNTFRAFMSLSSHGACTHFACTEAAVLCLGRFTYAPCFSLSFARTKTNGKIRK